MNDKLQPSLEKVKSTSSYLIRLLNNHKFSTIFVISGVSVMIALLQTGLYLNPARNDTKFNEEKLKINYSTIDQEVVDKLRDSSQQSASFEIDPQFVPNRSNPFAE